MFAFGPPPIQGLGAAGGFQMELQDRGGLGLGQLETFANDLVAAGKPESGAHPRQPELRASVPQIYVDVDREKAKTLGIPLQSVFNTLQANLGSAYVNDFNLFGRTWRVMVQADQQFRRRVDDIKRLEVRSAAGQMVPLGTLVRSATPWAPRTINRFNMFPVLDDHRSADAGLQRGRRRSTRSSASPGRCCRPRWASSGRG